TYSNWYYDGPFKTCPLIFTQLYTIHVFISDKIIPVLYTLLPNKSTIIDDRIYAPFLSPSRIIIDFEKSALRSIQTKFPDVTVSGCYFHFSQNLWCKTQSESDMFARYKTDSELTQYVRIPSFAPANDVIIALNILSTNKFIISKILTLVELTTIQQEENHFFYPLICGQ
ncbi:LOW QUALITY PROTEIN: hypothetical protein HZS_7399, partial [Henneguya salminicola]